MTIIIIKKCLHDDVDDDYNLCSYDHYCCYLFSSQYWKLSFPVDIYNLTGDIVLCIYYSIKALQIVQIRRVLDRKDN